MNKTYRVASDIGGTFTDLILCDSEGKISQIKVPSTSPNYSEGVVSGTLALLERVRAEPSQIEDVLHACTVGTNAILSKEGARTALLMTKGFRDILYLRRIRVPRLYEPLYRKPEPLVPRHLSFEIDERMDAYGNVLRPIEEESLERVIDELRHAEPEAIVVSFLHSYANPSHEQYVVKRLRRIFIDTFICASHDILMEAGEYERTSTAVINGYIGPPVRRYLDSLIRSLSSAGIHQPLRLMQSSGGIMDADAIVQRPVQIVESGPAAGVIGAAALGHALGENNLITFDMGGTTAKASLIEHGHALMTDEYEVGGPVSGSAILGGGNGYALRLPSVDISEVGAGGGSVASFRHGTISVGPESVGSDPGPACYGKGNRRPTVTDASVVLGYLGADSLAGGALPIDAARSVRAIEEHLCQPLSCDATSAAFGIHAVVNANMVQVIKTVTTYRGRDPRNFTLFGFGGNGGIHAVELARMLRIRRVLIPYGAGTFSAFGLLTAREALVLTQALLMSTGQMDFERLSQAFAALEDRIASSLQKAPRSLQWERALAMRYRGQAFEIDVPYRQEELAEGGIAHLEAKFADEHERTRGHRIQDAMIEIVRLKARGSVMSTTPLNQAPSSADLRKKKANRNIYFGPSYGFMSVPIIGRPELVGGRREGPLIIEDYDATIVVPPYARAGLGSFDSVVVELDEGATYG